MTESPKIGREHLERDACLYIRQSSMRQVVENTESTKRQYALRARAIALGWSEDRIVTIDCDQGESGASAVWREGFRRLVTEVGLGRVGIVMGLEVSRLARNNADWHRLLEICAIAGTLILDEDGVYDPTSFNDRLLLGLKGTMSEAELYVLKARLRGGILNKVRRGEYRCTLPTGLVYDEGGAVVLDPDSQVRETIAHFFETFPIVGSLHQTVKVFRRENILFPSRVRNHGIVFRPLTESAGARMLHNPRYAGAYVYGRRRFRRTPDGKRTVKTLDCQDWTTCIPDAHPGYVTWSQYESNLLMLAANGRGYELARQSPPREGTALLQGIAICGRCGESMRPRYRSCRGSNESWYVCDRGSARSGESNCQSISGNRVDRAVGTLVAELMTPIAIDLAIEVRAEILARHEEADRLRGMVVERARIEAELAQRRYMAVDPDNRLVANTLESDWNAKLRALSKARDDRQSKREEDLVALDGTIRERLLSMTTDFQKIWSDPETPNRERKRMLAHVIQDVTLVRVPEERCTRIHVVFKGGRTETLTTPKPRTSAEAVTTAPEIIRLIDELLDHHIYAEIAGELNKRGIRPPGSVRPGRENIPFDSRLVKYLVHRYALRSRYDRLRDRGLLTTAEMAKHLGIHQSTLKSWAEHGIVKRHLYNGHFYLYEDPGPDIPVKQCSRWNTLAQRSAARANPKTIKILV